MKSATTSPLNPLSTGPFTIVTDNVFLDTSIDSAMYKFLYNTDSFG